MKLVCFHGSTGLKHWEFCEKINWHPVDELHLKDEFIKRLKNSEKGRFVKVASLDEMFED